MGWFLVVVALAACGRISFDPIAGDPEPDAATRLTYRDAVLADHPVAYWRLGDASTTVHDEQGQHDATFAGTCPVAAGALAGDANAATTFDHACTFTAGTDFHFAGKAAFSIEVWIRSSTIGSTQFTIMNEQRNMQLTAPINGWAIVIDNDGVYGERPVATIAEGTPRIPLAATGFDHVVFIYDGTQFYLFVDGVSDGMYADTRVMPAYTAELDVGGVPAIPAAFENGALDELAIYDYALPGPRITLHHDLGLNGPQPL